jgi:hypothetical protein
MNAIQLDLFTGAIVTDGPVAQVESKHDASLVSGYDVAPCPAIPAEASRDAAGFDGWSPEMGSPCKSCYLREWCSDECARLGFKIDSKYEPRGSWAQWLAK